MKCSKKRTKAITRGRKIDKTMTVKSKKSMESNNGKLRKQRQQNEWNLEYHNKREKTALNPTTITYRPPIKALQWKRKNNFNI